jgi:hypothetical protein
MQIARKYLIEETSQTQGLGYVQFISDRVKVPQTVPLVTIPYYGVQTVWRSSFYLFISFQFLGNLTIHFSKCLILAD